MGFYEKFIENDFVLRTYLCIVFFNVWFCYLQIVLYMSIGISIRLILILHTFCFHF